MNFKQLAGDLLSQARSLVPAWLPGGKVQANEYVCGSISGGPGDSFRVNLRTGKWAEFSGNLKGGDLISLYAAVKGISQGDAYKQLGGTATPQTSPPPMVHPKHGPAVMTWTYRSAAGNVLFHVARYDTPTGKEFLPWREISGKWVCRGPDAPRPLYGLDLMASRPEAPVLVVEGEKAADAARKIAPTFVVTTWPNGAKAWAKTDWKPVFGRKIVLWPDADPPGREAMEGIASLLAPHCPAIKVLSVTDRPAGWDAADAAQAGMTQAELYPWIKQTIVLVVPPASPPVEEALPTESQSSKIEDLGLATSQNGAPICNTANVIRFLSRVAEFSDKVWWDDFSQRIMTTDGQWTDHLTIGLMVRLQTDYGMHRITGHQVAEAVEFFAMRHRRHSAQDWLNSLKWDGKIRIREFFCTHMGAERTASHYAFSSNFWTLMVKRALRPGSQADYMVVLEGPQGIGKTRAFQAIGKDWYAEVGITADSEDFERQLQSKILVEVAELQSFSKSDQTRIKQIITKRVDRYREKYGRIAIDHPRQCILVGTTNEAEWIKDQTGGRRFWPVRCGEIDIAAIERDREQLFAEAVANLKDGDEGYHVPKQEVMELQEARREGEPWEELLKSKLALTVRVTLAEAMAILGIPNERMNSQFAKRVAHALRRIGFESKLHKIQGEVKRYWSKNGSVTVTNSVTGFHDGE